MWINMIILGLGLRSIIIGLKSVLFIKYDFFLQVLIKTLLKG